MYTVRYSVYRLIALFMSNKHIERLYTKVGLRQHDIFKQVTNNKNVTETAKS